MILPSGQDQREEKLVPGGDEREDGRRDETGCDDGEDDAPKNLPYRAPVDERRLVEVARNRFVELSHQEDPERIHAEREHDADKGIQQIQPEKDSVDRDHDHLLRDHHGTEDGHEDQVLPGEGHSFQGISRKR